jgi:protein-tyrosine phosphatase
MPPTPEVLDWRESPDPQAVVERAARTLAAGGLVAFPTDTVYTLAARALDPVAVDRLPRPAPPGRHVQTASGEPSWGEAVLAVHGASDALARVPAMSLLGQRLARRCWPGPVTLAFPGGHTADLPDSVARRLAPGGRLHLRSPAHLALHLVLRASGGPLVLAETDAVTAGELLRSLPTDAGPGTLVLDDGPTLCGQPATVVGVDGARWQVLREGAVTVEAVRRQTACLVLFVCTGNTCRSPLAEALFRRKLADRLGCHPDDLTERGFVVQSAGLAAMMGGGAAEESVRQARAYGAALEGHVSQPLTPALAAQADHLVVMTRGHLQSVQTGFRRLAAEPRLLDPAGDDLADPIGGSPEVYRQCAARIWQHLDRLAEDLLGSPAGRPGQPPATPETFPREHTGP